MKFNPDHIDQFIGLIVFLSQKHTKNSTVSHYDLIQSGYLGLAKAIKNYNGSSPLKNWAFRVIRSEIIKARYKNGKERKELNGLNDYISTSVSSDDYNPLKPIYEKEEEIIKESKLQQIYAILNNIDDSQSLNRKIYIDRIINGHRIIDLSKSYNLSYNSINHRIKKINDLIKSKIKENQPNASK